MISPLTPLRWPNSWQDPATLALLEGTSVDALLMDAGEGLAAVRSAAQGGGLHVLSANEAPPNHAILKGEWPGVRMARGGRGASAGPTGVPWINSNGWAIRLALAMQPETMVWVDAPPPKDALLSADAYRMAVADSAAHGGRWILSLDDRLVQSLAGRQPQALATWQKLTEAAAWFAARRTWSTYVPMGVAGVVSSFSGGDEFFSRELLNLLARGGLHYLIVPKSHVGPESFNLLRALVYVDQDPPAPRLRQQILGFVQAGGVLITAPVWGEAGTPAPGEEHPRFQWRALGKGRIAVAREAPTDPYEFAQDAVVLVSHRYDLVRFWNGGATASYYAITRDRRNAIVHLLFYANRGPDSAAVRIVGRFRTVKASTLDDPAVHVETVSEKDAIEVHLPQVSQYVALQLEV